MPYIINRYSGAQVAFVEDGRVNQSTSLKLVGKNYVGYGEIQNENFIYLLENFASPTPPDKPISGQLWFNSNSNIKTINLYTGSTWRQLNSIEVSAEQPTTAENGSFWFNTSTEQTFIKIDDSYKLVGPEAVADFGITRAVSTTIRDTNSNDKPIIKILVDNTVIAIISKTTFTILNEDAITGFHTLEAGMTMCNEFILKGIASSANKLETARNINGVSFDGTSNITVTAAAGTLTGTALASSVISSSLTSVGTLTGLTVSTAINADLSGNASTATKLATSRTINGVSFDGSANVTIYDSSKLPLSGGTLTGDLSLSGLPTLGEHAANKTYVDSAVASITVVPQGLICMWSGTIANIPAGWALCNGSNGTPNLTNKFIIGASTDSDGRAKTSVTGDLTYNGGNKDAVVVSHNHNGSFTGNAMPNHSHTASVPNHYHYVAKNVGTGDVASNWVSYPNMSVTYTHTTGGPHSYTFTGTDKAAGFNYASEPTANIGASSGPVNGGTVTTSNTSAGTPSGSITVNSNGEDGGNKNLPPYYALAYIMKL